MPIEPTSKMKVKSIYSDLTKIAESNQYGFRIERLKARRNINREADKRGQISELLILNYDPNS